VVPAGEVNVIHVGGNTVDAIVIGWCVGFVALLALKGFAGQWIHARISGWGRLGQRYPGSGACRCKPFDRAVIRVRSHWYHQTPIVGVDGAGLRLSMRPALRPFHPPVFIPWDDITADEVGEDGALPLRVGESATLTLTGPAATAVARLLDRRAHGTHRRSR
jgi:hypothetical protein